MTLATPFWLAAGVTVTVRLAPLPPNAMFPFGTNVVFDELPLTVKLPAAVSASPTVKPIPAVAVSSLVVWLAMLVIVGAVLVDVDRQLKTRGRAQRPVAHRHRDVGNAVLVGRRRHRHRAVGAAAAKDDIPVRHQCRVGGRTADRQAACGGLDVPDREAKRPHGRTLVVVWLAMLVIVGESLTAFTVN